MSENQAACARQQREVPDLTEEEARELGWGKPKRPRERDRSSKALDDASEWSEKEKQAAYERQKREVPDLNQEEARAMGWKGAPEPDGKKTPER